MAKIKRRVYNNSRLCALLRENNLFDESVPFGLPLAGIGMICLTLHEDNLMTDLESNIRQPVCCAALIFIRKTVTLAGVIFTDRYCTAH